MADRLPRVTADQVLRALRRDGWHPDDQSGSHISLRHPQRPGYVTVPYHRRRTLKLKTIASIVRQAGLTVNEFRELL